LWCHSHSGRTLRFCSFSPHLVFVIRDVLSDEETKTTLQEFYDTIEGGSEASDSELERVYGRQKFAKFGIIGGYPDVKSITQLENRQNPKVYEAFCAVFNCRKLICDHDRLGVMRPTMRESGEKTSWRTLSRWLHLDCNPTIGRASIGGFQLVDDSSIDFEKTLIIQGLLTLTDAREEDGGFHCVPGGHKLSIEWAKHNPSRSDNMQVGMDDPIRELVQKIPIKKGCLLAWNSLLFHGNHPNFSTHWRGVQYIRMLPAEGTPYCPLVPELEFYPAHFKMTPLGRKLFGLEKYEDDKKAA